MKITGYRSLSTVQDWGRVTGDVDGVQSGETTPVPVLVIETDSGIEGVGVGAHGDIARVFPAVEGEDPRSVVALYDRMLDWVFKAGHSGPVFGTIAAVDMALWDIKAKAADETLWRMLGARERFVPGYASGLEYGLTDEELAELYGRFADRGFKAASSRAAGAHLHHPPGEGSRDSPRHKSVLRSHGSPTELRGWLSGVLPRSCSSETAPPPQVVEMTSPAPGLQMGPPRFDGHPRSGACTPGGCSSWSPWTGRSRGLVVRSLLSSRPRSSSCVSVATGRSVRSRGTSI